MSRYEPINIRNARYHIFCDLETWDTRLTDHRVIFMFGMAICEKSPDGLYEICAMENIVFPDGENWSVSPRTLAWHAGQTSWQYISDALSAGNGKAPKHLRISETLIGAKNLIMDTTLNQDFLIWGNRQFDYPLISAALDAYRLKPHPLGAFTAWRDASAYRDDFQIPQGQLQKHTPLTDCRNNIPVVQELLCREGLMR